ncbi:MAG: hypothetical protein J7J03_03220 [Methanosarcinales archaeon]|nr:hypothetical protein [Methanosarcinales archaeon]
MSSRIDIDNDASTAKHIQSTVADHTQGLEKFSIRPESGNQSDQILNAPLS